MKAKAALAGGLAGTSTGLESTASTQEQAPLREHFGIVAERAADYYWLSKSALRLYIKLGRYADAYSRVARPGQDRLASELGWIDKDFLPDRRRVFRYMKELRDADLVRLAGQHSLGNHRWVREYLVAPFPDLEDANVSDASSREEDAALYDASSVGVTIEDATNNQRGCDQNGVEDANALVAPFYQSSSTQSSSLPQLRENASLNNPNGKKTPQPLTEEQKHRSPSDD